MAMSSTTACIPHYRDTMPSFLKPTQIPLSHYFGSISFRKAPTLLRFVARSSDEAASSSSTTETWEGESSGSSVEVAKGPPSIISALNVEKALRGIAITDVDHYGRLGLQRGCTYDLVRVTYQNRVKELESQGLDDEKLNKELDLLKESYRILSTEEERRLYDWSLSRSEGPERYVWPFEVDLTQTAIKGTPPAQEPENVGPTIVVGYFLLGWLVLAFTLSIILNQV
ncbi:NAD(P)H-quinone oxidoreductase subunit U, chloroplastic [Silene latifolia]|uniref:NAD(P)H-quinone oxidoreductase subunit U, chloroplastic n=1 Tax=Silene latifolia TaxID=37657 RepID=UPI003D78B24B